MGDGWGEVQVEKILKFYPFLNESVPEDRCKRFMSCLNPTCLVKYFVKDLRAV